MSWKEVEDFLRSGQQVKAPIEARLGQCLSYWDYKEGTVPRERGVAQLVVENGNLVAYGAFEDHDIHNNATEDNQETWELGDVFELFFQVHGHTDYYEAHTTPEGIRLQLHIQSWQTMRQESWESKLTDIGLKVKNEIRREENLWLARLELPFAEMELTEDLLNGSRFVFAHYSYTRGKEKPEITSTQVFPSTCHFVPQWHELKN